MVRLDLAVCFVRVFPLASRTKVVEGEDAAKDPEITVLAGTVPWNTYSAR